MLIACAGDAHRSERDMEAMLRALPAVDALCFLGDVDADAQYLRRGLRTRQPNAAFYAVSGNCDLFPKLPASLTIRVPTTRAFVTHGHLFRVKQGLTLLAESAREMDCRLVLFGHTHIVCDRWVSGARLVNPGALRDGRYALIRCEAGTALEMEVMLRNTG
ncbi:MAG: YfcE family phosphodiesterase [Clostridia bacterium]|nr:YfcE family phosphodiesterase [Clostridia bacterium]